MRIKENLFGPVENETSFEQIISQNEKKILNLIYGMTGDYHLAEDLSQEVFLKAFQAKDGFHGKAKFSTWLYRIAVNVVIDHQRKSCVKKENPADTLDQGQSASPASDPDSACQKKAIRDILFKAIASLPEQQKEVYVLREVNGCSTKETAEILECSAELVKWRLHKARSMLRKMLKENQQYKNAGTIKLNEFGIE
jgi:RNA polymerase sigma-70 factor (ECF subfamily)